MVENVYIYAVKLLLSQIPKWAKNRRLVLLAGRETLFEYNPADKLLKIKDKRCTNCGECCLNLAPGSVKDIHWGTDYEGKCKKVYKQGDKWLCGANYDQPYRCFPDPSLNAPGCEMTFYEEKL